MAQKVLLLWFFTLLSYAIVQCGGNCTPKIQSNSQNLAKNELEIDFNQVDVDVGIDCLEESEENKIDIETWHIYAVCIGTLLFISTLMTFGLCWYFKCCFFQPTNNLNDLHLQNQIAEKRFRPRILIARNPVPAPFLMEQNKGKDKILENEILPKMTLSYEDLPPPYPGAPRLNIKTLQQQNEKTNGGFPPSYKQSTIEIWL